MGSTHCMSPAWTVRPAVCLYTSPIVRVISDGTWNCTRRRLKEWFRYPHTSDIFLVRSIPPSDTSHASMFLRTRRSALFSSRVRWCCTWSMYAVDPWIQGGIGEPLRRSWRKRLNAASSWLTNARRRSDGISAIDKRSTTLFKSCDVSFFLVRSSLAICRATSFCESHARFALVVHRRFAWSRSGRTDPLLFREDWLIVAERIWMYTIQPDTHRIYIYIYITDNFFK